MNFITVPEMMQMVFVLQMLLDPSLEPDARASALAQLPGQRARMLTLLMALEKPSAASSQT
jgi:hypothetical protein